MNDLLCSRPLLDNAANGGPMALALWRCGSHGSTRGYDCSATELTFAACAPAPGVASCAPPFSASCRVNSEPSSCRGGGVDSVTAFLGCPGTPGTSPCRRYPPDPRESTARSRNALPPSSKRPQPGWSSRVADILQVASRSAAQMHFLSFFLSFSVRPSSPLIRSASACWSPLF